MSAAFRVLLVDDEPDFLDYTAKRLRQRGLDVDVAPDAFAALERLREGTFHVVVLDVKMPGMDGHELFRRIAADFPAIETIILTGYGDVRTACELGRQGVFEYLSKPCDIDTLNDLIRKARQYAIVRGERPADAGPAPARGGREEP
jgi:DNA-binding NtrC family response regulator